MKVFLLSIFALTSIAALAQEVPTLKLLHSYTDEDATGSTNFGSDLFISNGKLYISARGDLSRYVDSYSLANDGTLSFIKKIEEKDSKMFGWSICASDDYIVSASSTEKKIYVYPQNGKAKYSVSLTGTSPTISLDGNTLIATSNGQIGLYRITDTELVSLYSLPSDEAKINTGTKPAIKGNLAAVCDRTNKKVIILEQNNGSWSKTAEVSIPDGTASLFGLAIGDGHIFAGDRGTGLIFDIVKQNGSWSIRQTITDGEGTTLGSFLAYDNGHLVAICNYTTKEPYNNSYVYTLNSNGNWEKTFAIKNNDDIRIGHVIALSGNDIYISNYNATIHGIVNVGAVYHYRLDKTEGNTPITIIKADRDSKDDIYDLQGRKINGTPGKGLFIKNGKLISIR